MTILRDPTAPGARHAPLGPTFVRLRRGVVVSLRSRLGGLFKSQSELELTDGSIPKSLFFLSLPIAYVASQGTVPVDLLVSGSWTPVDIWFAFAVSGITAALVAASWFELGTWRGMDLSSQPDDGASAPADGAAASGDAAGDAEPRSDARAATTVVSVRCIVSRSAYCSITERSPAPGRRATRGLYSGPTVQPAVPKRYETTPARRLASCRCERRRVRSLDRDDLDLELEGLAGEFRVEVDADQWTCSWERRTWPVALLSGTPGPALARTMHRGTTDCSGWPQEALGTLEQLRTSVR